MPEMHQNLSHFKWDCKYHVVFIPKRRRKVVFGKMRQQLGEIFHALTRQKECRILEGHLMPDHVHMCIAIPPKHESTKIRGVGRGFMYARLMSKPVSTTPQNDYDLATSEGTSRTKFRLQLVIENNSGQEEVHEMAHLEREAVERETLGLTLAEGKLILKKIQEGVVREQIHDALARRRHCPDCGKARHRKGHHDITIRTLFGNLELQSPRLEHCGCQPHAEKTFSPLQTVLPEHISPEMLYLEVKWSSLLPYEVSGDLLQEVLP